MSAELGAASQPASLPDRVITDWKRFSTGLWRIPEGDIAGAYSADTFPKIQVFKHEGRLFTNGGCAFSKSIQVAADCYPLIRPEEYRGPESVDYSYEGRIAIFQRQEFKLGPKLVFVSSDLTIAEWREHFRILYADGGMFTHGVTYSEFLLGRIDPETANEIAAQREELIEC